MSLADRAAADDGPRPGDASPDISVPYVPRPAAVRLDVLHGVATPSHVGVPLLVAAGSL